MIAPAGARPLPSKPGRYPGSRRGSMGYGVCPGFFTYSVYSSHLGLSELRLAFTFRLRPRLSCADGAGPVMHVPSPLRLFHGCKGRRDGVDGCVFPSSPIPGGEHASRILPDTGGVVAAGARDGRGPRCPVSPSRCSHSVGAGLLEGRRVQPRRCGRHPTEYDPSRRDASWRGRWRVARRRERRPRPSCPRVAAG